MNASLKIFGDGMLQEASCLYMVSKLNWFYIKLENVCPSECYNCPMFGSIQSMLSDAESCTPIYGEPQAVRSCITWNTSNDGQYYLRLCRKYLLLTGKGHKQKPVSLNKRMTGELKL